MNKRQVLINAAMSVLQTIIIGVVLFVLYRFLLDTLGVKQLGIWSLVLSTTSIAQIANFGLSGSVTKFVAKYTAIKEKQNVSGVIQTATISIGGGAGLVLLISFPIIKRVLAFVVEKEALPLAFAILPYALLSLWLQLMLSVLQSALDGRQRIDLRSSILIGSSVLNLILCFILVPSHGLMGVAYARVAQMSVSLVVLWFVLSAYVKLPLVPWRWKKCLFKEMVGYGLKFQAMSLTSMLYDPATKALLSKFGDLSMVGYYEMANSLLQQFRALIVSTNQVLFPAIADLQEREPEKIDSTYRISYQLLFYLALPMYSLIIISLPIISELWIGRYDGIFVNYAILLAFGWLLNTLAGPAFFVYLGIGQLGWNLAGRIVIMVLNIVLGMSLGAYWGGTGVVVAWVIALAIGSSVIYISYHLKFKISLVELLPPKSGSLLMLCMLSLLFFFLLHDRIARSSVTELVASTPILLGLWFHPMRNRLAGWAINILSDSKNRA